MQIVNKEGRQKADAPESAQKDWHCKEFSRRIWVELEEQEGMDIFILHPYMIEHEMPDFDFNDCAFIGEDGRAFYPETGKFLTEDRCWYIKPPKKFYVYSDRADKYEWAGTPCWEGGDIIENNRI